MERYTFDFHVQNKHVTHTIYRGYESNEVKKRERERENRSFDTLCQKYTTKSSNTQKETISTAFWIAPSLPSSVSCVCVCVFIQYYYVYKHVRSLYSFVSDFYCFTP